LPPLNYDNDNYIEDAEDEDNDDWVYTADGKALGKKIVASLAGIAEAVRSEGGFTPPPDWTRVPEYRLEQEGVLEAQIFTITSEVARLQEHKSKIEKDLHNMGNLRRLMYEQGHPLERSILEALHLFGFHAETVIEGESEFDAIFTSPEGRFLGEVEGKDRSAVNIDKLSQLERNIQEDYAKDGVEEYANGVLFGNAYRLMPMSERQDSFTAKCLAGAQRSHVALIRTADMFGPARYLKENEAPDYARQCREAIAKGGGMIVVFPPLPVNELTITKGTRGES